MGGGPDPSARACRSSRIAIARHSNHCGNTLLVSDVPGPTGGILLQTAAGAFISVSDTGIIINNGQGATIAMTGPAVTVNEGAMEVI